MEKEEKAIILDFLPHGYPLEGKMTPIAQALGTTHFTLLQLVPRRGVKLALREEVYIGPGKRDKIYYILSKLPKDKLTETAKLQLQDFAEEFTKKNAKELLEFFNKSTPLNTRLHQLELLPGFGAKHTKAILAEREKKPFTSFEDIKKRIKNIPDPQNAIKKRLLDELTAEERYNLFIR